MNMRQNLAIMALLGLLASPASVLAFADPDASNVGFDIKAFAGSFQGIENPNNTGLVDSLINIINALLVLAAIAAIAFIIIGGVRYITAQGDEDAIAQAKNTVIFTIIGIIVILLAAVIVNFFTAQIG